MVKFNLPVLAIGITAVQQGISNTNLWFFIGGLYLITIAFIFKPEDKNTNKTENDNNSPT